MNNIPTAEEFFRKRYEELKMAPPEDFNDTDVLIAREFAKLHVKAALTAAQKSNNQCFRDKESWCQDVTEAYSLNNIK
jgi:hypothetical protein